MTRLAQDCYHGSETCRFTEPSKNHLAGWFFRLQGKRLRLRRNNLKKIIRAKEIKQLPTITHEYTRIHTKIDFVCIRVYHW